MTKRRLFIWVAAAGGYIGFGMILGYLLSDQANNTPLWVGGILLLLGAVLLGMFISSRYGKDHALPERKDVTTETNST